MAVQGAQRERLNRELEITREVQKDLFPQELLLVAKVSVLVEKAGSLLYCCP
jgi:hypothetical protein